ncbi:MAG: DnaJ domain-containing protein [Deltaproteobacteria bacterium]|nr:DnaJ domain-containing protein [Deltaproteobacteria bacterium]
MGRILAVIAWLIYFLSPLDLIPDFIPGVGRMDDLILLFLLIYSFMKKGTGDAPGTSNPHGHHKGGGYSESASRQRPDDGNSREPKDPYAILGVSRSATMDEIKHAYRTQASRYHPDKVAHLGEEFQTLANRKFQEIQGAYETILKERKPPL